MKLRRRQRWRLIGAETPAIRWLAYRKLGGGFHIYSDIADQRDAREELLHTCGLQCGEGVIVLE